MRRTAEVVEKLAQTRRDFSRARRVFDLPETEAVESNATCAALYGAIQALEWAVGELKVKAVR